jgi:hypothetical protein
MSTVSLSTSDWVTITVGLAQLLVAVGVGAWTIRRSAPVVIAQSDFPSKSKPWSFFWSWFKTSWLFLLCSVYGFYEVWALGVDSGDLSKSVVLRIVLYATYAIFNAVASVGFFIVQFQLDIMSQITGVIARMSQVHGDALETHGKHLAITERLLEKSKLRRRRAE